MKFEAELARRLLTANKTILPCEWLKQNNRTCISASLMADDPLSEMALMHAIISNGSFNKATFSLQMSVRGQRQRFRIYALDWNPTTPHSNGHKQNDPDSLSIIAPGQTHTHHFEDRIDDRTPDGFARPLQITLETYDDALGFFCAKINLTRPPHLPKPPVQGNLL